MFGLADHPKLKHAKRGSPRMFKNDFIEKYGSRVKPWHVLLIWVPIVLYTARISVLAQVPATTFLGLFAGGVVFWTLLEYILHRWLFHFTPHGAVQEDISFLIHGIHHDYPWDADRLVMPPFVSLLIGASLYYPFQWALGPDMWGAAYAGAAVGYLWYDLSHYAFHHIKPRTAIGRYLRNYHLVHHFKTPKLRYGVSTPLWDYVFRTQPRADEKNAGHSLIAEDHEAEAAAH